jgi:hypothetical protein
MAAHSMTRSTDTILTITVIDGADQPLDLTGKTLRFTAKRHMSDDQADAVIAKSSGNGITHLAQSGDTLGEAEVAIVPGDTATLPAYTVALFYDVELADGDERYQTESGTLSIMPDVTTA